MGFVEHYKELLLYAKKVIGVSNYLEPDDLINEVYLKLHSDKFNIHKYKKWINGIFLDHKRHASGFQSLNGIECKKNKLNSELRFCKKCKDIKPIQAFRFVETTHNRPWSYYLHTCLECENNKKYLLRKKVKPKEKEAQSVDPKTERLRQSWRRANKKYLSTEKGLNKKNECSKKWQDRQKLNLTDSYIKLLLRARNISIMDITPQMIEEERKKQIIKRETGIYIKKSRIK